MRPSFKFASRGISLAHPPDQMPAGFFPVLRNVRLTQLGALETRPGVKLVRQVGGGPVHTLRLVANDVDSTSVLLTGIGTKLLRDNTEIASGFSGKPLSLQPFRPNKSPYPYVYVGDEQKMLKVSATGEALSVGIKAPTHAPAVELDFPVFRVVDALESGVWIAGGEASAVAFQPRFNTTIAQVFYDQVGRGWCSILPTDNQGFRAGAKIILGTETCRVAEVLEAISDTTIAGIIYDEGPTGPCSITFKDQSSNLKPNCIISLGGEHTRVLDVVMGLDGTPSIRCSTAIAHNVGEPVLGKLSFRAFTEFVHPDGETLHANRIEFTVDAGTGTATATYSQDLNSIYAVGIGAGRPVQPADYMHVSVFVDQLAKFTKGRIMIDVGDGSFTQNYLYKSFTPGDLSGDGQWKELVFKVSDLIRVGTDESKSLSTVAGLRFEATATASILISFSGWWVAGTYGMDSTADEAAVLYAFRYKDSRTGVKSNPSPATRTGIYPKREQAVIELVESPDPQVDTIELLRFGGGLNQWVVVGSFPNRFGNVVDATATNAVLANEVGNFDDYQPFPISDLPKAGTCDVSGTTVEWLSGDKFNTDWVSGSLIVVGGKVCTLYGSPLSDTKLFLTESAGYGHEVAFSLPEPTIAGRPMPAMWMYGGQGIGTFMFGVGDPYNPGFLRWTKGNDPDAASDKGGLEVTPPSEKLLNGFVYDSRNFCFSADRLFVIQPNFSGQGNEWVANEVVSGAGMFSRWAFCVTPFGVAWVGKDGIYLWTGGSPKNLTNEALYPLFPHSGVEVGPVNGFYPPDYAKPDYLRLSYASGSLYFTYLDTVGNLECMRWDFAWGGWFPESYTKQPVVFYQEEGGNLPVLVGTIDGAVERVEGIGMDDADKTPCHVKTPYSDYGDSRGLKYFPDAMLDYQVPELLNRVWFDNDGSFIDPPNLGSDVRTQETLRIALEDGANVQTHRNIALELFWDGPGKLWEWQPSAVPLPDGAVSTTGILSQYTTHGITGYSHEKEAWVTLISKGPVDLTVYVDGVPHVYTIPSTNGQHQRVRIPLGPLKGKLFLYKISGPDEFIPFKDQIDILVKPWGSDNPFLPIRPFLEAQAIAA